MAKDCRLSECRGWPWPQSGADKRPIKIRLKDTKQAVLQNQQKATATGGGGALPDVGDNTNRVDGIVYKWSVILQNSALLPNPGPPHFCHSYLNFLFLYPDVFIPLFHIVSSTKAACNVIKCHRWKCLIVRDYCAYGSKIRTVSETLTCLRPCNATGP